MRLSVVHPVLPNLWSRVFGLYSVPDHGPLENIVILGFGLHHSNTAGVVDIEPLKDSS